MKKLLLFFSVIFAIASCGSQNTKTIIVTTSNPIYAIIKEIAGPRVDVRYIIPPGASPHTYQPKPSDVYKSQAANVLIYAADNNDGWAAKLPGSRSLLQLVELIPREYWINYRGERVSASDTTITTKNIDTHFWMDPLTVKAMLPAIADTLAKLDPQNAATYRTNAELFSNRLDLLHRQVDNLLHNVKGKTVFLHHPSIMYMLQRYGLLYGGSIEEAPGKEPSPKYIASLIQKIKESGAKAIFNEPQLSDKAVKSIADEAKVSVYLLDPVGGTSGRENYQDLILFNARTLAKALAGD